MPTENAPSAIAVVTVGISHLISPDEISALPRHQPIWRNTRKSDESAKTVPAIRTVARPPRIAPNRIIRMSVLPTSPYEMSHDVGWRELDHARSADFLE